MSVEIEKYIMCDYCKDTFNPEQRNIGMLFVDIRKSARANGWIHIRKDDTDYCSKACRETEVKK